MKLDHYLTPYIKINSKWIKDLNVKPETIKPNNLNKIWTKDMNRYFSKEDVQMSNLFNVGLVNDFLDLTSRAKATKAKINNWYYIKSAIGM